MITCIVRLLDRLHWHRWNDSIDSHEEVIAALAPFSELVLLKARIEDPSRLERFVLVRHSCLLSLQLLPCFLFFADLFSIASTSRLAPSCGRWPVVLGLIGRIISRCSLFALAALPVSLTSTTSSGSFVTIWGLLSSSLARVFHLV